MSSSYILNGSREYSIYVCENRAIPKIQDGLKSGQRIALWLMKDRAEPIKTFALSGLMGFQKLYVHGEASANNAISLLAAPYKNNEPLLTGMGAFGSRTKPVDGIGAPRYTQVKRSEIAKKALYADLDIVPLEDNYDGSNQQPVHFLPLIPLVLLNGVVGVAVGYSTEILPRKFIDVLNATKNALLGKTTGIIDPYYKNYDLKISRNGDKWIAQGKVSIIDTTNARITELPPGLSLETFKERLNVMEESNKIVDYYDNSANSIDVVVKFKRGELKDSTPENLINFFKLSESLSERLVVVGWDGSSIHQYPDTESLIKDFVKWRLEWYVTRFEKLHLDTSYELNYWRVLKVLFDGGFTKKLGTFADRADMETEVTRIVTKAKLSLDKPQMDRVLSLATYRWTKDFAAEIASKISDMENSIADYEDILASPEKRKAIYLSELEALKKL